MPNTDEVLAITIPLHPMPAPGPASLIPRVRDVDRNKINMAASTLSLSQAQFMRLVLVHCAEAVLDEHGVPYDD